MERRPAQPTGSGHAANAEILSVHATGKAASAQTLSLVAALSSALAVALNIFSKSASPTTLVLGQAVTNTIASVLTTPFAAAATVALYFDLRIRDEAFDVQIAMANTQAAR